MFQFTPFENVHLVTDRNTPGERRVAITVEMAGNVKTFGFSSDELRLWDARTERLYIEAVAQRTKGQGVVDLTQLIAVSAFQVTTTPADDASLTALLGVLCHWFTTSKPTQGTLPNATSIRVSVDPQFNLHAEIAATQIL